MSCLSHSKKCCERILLESCHRVSQALKQAVRKTDVSPVTAISYSMLFNLFYDQKTPFESLARFVGVA